MYFSRSETTKPHFVMPAVLQFMTRWTECLHGEGSLRETLVCLADLASAEVVHLHRVDMETGAQRTIATMDLSAPRGARPLARALGMALAGSTLSRAKPGTLWSMRELDEDAASRLDPRCLSWMAERRLSEALMIPLSLAGNQGDVLEVYQSAPLDRSRRIAIEMLALAAAEAWGRRPKGRIARLLRAAPAIRGHLRDGSRVTHPLSESNPLGLTASEMRICGMIQRGVDLADVSKTLGIAESTLRSHLSSIFSKAGVAGQVGLVRLLLGPDAAQSSMRA